MSFVETTLASLMMGTIKVVSGQVLIKLVSVERASLASGDVGCSVFRDLYQVGSDKYAQHIKTDFYFLQTVQASNVKSS
jgi:hypothetical protein